MLTEDSVWCCLYFSSSCTSPQYDGLRYVLKKYRTETLLISSLTAVICAFLYFSRRQSRNRVKQIALKEHSDVVRTAYENETDNASRLETYLKRFVGRTSGTCVAQGRAQAGCGRPPAVVENGDAVSLQKAHDAINEFIRSVDRPQQPRAAGESITDDVPAVPDRVVVRTTPPDKPKQRPPPIYYLDPVAKPKKSLSSPHLMNGENAILNTI